MPTVITNSPEKLQKTTIYLPKIGGVYLCRARMYSTIIVKTTVVRLKVVYMGTLTPRTDSIVTNFQKEIAEHVDISKSRTSSSRNKLLQH